MKKVYLTEQKARKIIRSLIENHMDFDSEAVRGNSHSIRHSDNYFEDYYNIMVVEIDYQDHMLSRLEFFYTIAVDKFIITWSEIKDSDLDNKRKELLREWILSIFKARKFLREPMEKIIRSLIVNPVNAIHDEDYYNSMVDEIENRYAWLSKLESQYQLAVDKFIITWSEIKNSDLDNKRKELLRERILSIFKARENLRGKLSIFKPME